MLPQTFVLSIKMMTSTLAIDSLWSCEASSGTLASSSLWRNCRSCGPSFKSFICPPGAIAGYPAFCFTCTQSWSDLSAWMTPRSRELENLSPETQLVSSHADSRSLGRRSICWRPASMLLGLACVAQRPATGTSPHPPLHGLCPQSGSPTSPRLCKDHRVLGRAGPTTGWQTPVGIVTQLAPGFSDLL